jgi:acyl-[acyl-carrier-protein]-phospholipid O-acyltransferase/long-chain-fatty-acid--[acyl-carrier-protein] ligase
VTVFGVLLSAQNLSFAHVLMLIAALGFSAGFSAVPVNALIQHRPDEKRQRGSDRSREPALLCWHWWSCGRLLLFPALRPFQPAFDFPVRLISNGRRDVPCLVSAPRCPALALLWIATHTLYRIHLEGRENIPAKGGALLVPNHAPWSMRFF